MKTTLTALAAFALAFTGAGCGHSSVASAPATLTSGEQAFLKQLEAVPTDHRTAFVAKNFKQMLTLRPLSKAFKDRFQADTVTLGKS